MSPPARRNATTSDNTPHSRHDNAQGVLMRQPQPAVRRLAPRHPGR
ncbi:hypothetical protein [Saccharothrix sp. NRRL B-16348]|nr:hypothetical protein [Saccharothrix sp. NRRL B-16348]